MRQPILTCVGGCHLLEQKLLAVFYFYKCFPELLLAASNSQCDAQQQCAGRPDLLLESLIMAQQFDAASEILKQAPHLQSDDLLRQYARHAPFPHLSFCHQQASTYEPIRVKEGHIFLKLADTADATLSSLR